MIKEDIYQSVLKTAYGLSLASIWQHLSVDIAERPTVNQSYSFRVDTFFYILRRLMKNEIIKLATNGKYLEGSVEQQIEMLRKIWPSNQIDVDLDEHDLWFLTDCPAGVVWITPEGQEVWT